MKLLRPHSGTGGVFFPIGKPSEGGTCEFATARCLKYCYVRRDVDFDEELHRVSEDDRRDIYERITTGDPREIAQQMSDELDQLQTYIVHWFCTGDCESKHEEQILNIMCELYDRGSELIVQMGFTRNVSIWKACRRYDVYMCRTMEIRDVKDIPDDLHGLFAIPHPRAKKTDIVCRTEARQAEGGCGYYVTAKEGKNEVMQHACNCMACHRKSIGCFGGN